MYTSTSLIPRLKNIIRYVTVFALSLFIWGCGTVTSLSHSDIELKNKLNQAKTLCAKTTRVYSGISYDFCQIHARESQSYSAVKTSYYLFDMIPSFIADTLLLPYTIMKQCNRGSIPILSTPNTDRRYPSASLDI